MSLPSNLSSPFLNIETMYCSSFEFTISTPSLGI